MKLRIDQATGALCCAGPGTTPGVLHTPGILSTPTLALYNRGGHALTPRDASRPHRTRVAIYESAQRAKENP